MQSQAQQWWQRAVVYQIYPRSFQDSDGDGIGDLAGIRQRLDYLAALGVGAIWLSPIFPSPMADFGYDIADYCGIDPIFGTLAGFDELVEETHARGLKLILDFVPNHTSIAHPWFSESRSSTTSPRRDWYIWRDPAPGGGPPNNWSSNFGGSAWTFDSATGQYYYHAFLPQQPDLNWRNPAVRAAMYDVLRFWMRRGVDGFRVDVLWHLMKDAGFRDNPPNPAWQPGRPEIERLLQVNSADQPEIEAILVEMRRVVDEFPDRVLIGEIYLPIERLMAYYGRDLSGVHLPFNFHLISCAWNARSIAALVADYDLHVPPGGWPNWVLGNHDQPRVATRVGAAGARLALMLLMTLRGTPTLYQGDELGLENVAMSPEDMQDPWERNEPGLGFSRDPQRTPMPWTWASNAGFSSHRPWLPIGTANAMRNVLAQERDPASMLAFARAMIAFRNGSPALKRGLYREIAVSDDLFAFERRTQEESLVVVLNFSHTAHPLPQELRGLDLVVSTGPASTGFAPDLIAGDTGLILRL